MYIEKKELSSTNLFFYLILFILIFPAFVDLFNGFIQLYLGKNFSVGIVYRSMLLLITIPFVFYLKETSYQLYLLLLISLWMIFNFIWAFNGYYHTFYSLTFELYKFIKILLPFVLLSFFFYVIKKYKIPIQQLMTYICIAAFIMSLFIIFSFATNIGFSTYMFSAHHGSKSFFISPNQLGLTLLISLTMSMYLTLSTFSFKKLLVSLSIFISMLLLGTRTAITGALGIYAIYLFSFFFYGKKEININPYKKILLLIHIVIILASGVYFFKFLLTNNPYLVTRFNLLLEGNVRIALIEAANIRINNRNFLLNVFGEGTLSFYKNVGYNLYGNYRKSKVGKGTEEDIRDTIGPYGFILGSFILIFPVIIWCRMFYFFVKDSNLLNLTFLLSITLYIGHSFIAGHAITNSYIAAAITLVYLYVLKYKNFNSKV